MNHIKRSVIFLAATGLFLSAGINFSTSSQAATTTPEPGWVINRITQVQREGNAVVLKSDRGMVRLSVIRPEIIRVQATDQTELRPALMVQAGFVKTDWPWAGLPLVVQDTANTVILSTGALKLVVTKQPFTLELFTAAGGSLFKTLPGAGVTLGRGTLLSCEMTAADHFFGFGYMRKCSDARGNTLTCTRSYRNDEATVPFFMNPRGYAFFSDNTWKNDFDFTKPDSFSLKTESGDMDFFLMVGSDFKVLLDSYTNLTGKPQLAPEWALGMEHRCQYFQGDEEVLEVARQFREYNIPCEVMALEPGWEEVPYSMVWVWSSGLFPDYRGTIKQLKKMGYKFDLWESGEAPKKDLLNPKVRQEWFAKRAAALTDWGVDMFKQDDPYPRGIKSEMMDAAVKSDGEISDQTRAPGELITVANTFYSQTVFEQWRKLTGRRPVVQFHAYNASIASQRWPYQWAGDFGTGWGLFNASLSGHAMANADARSPYLDGRHLDFFMSAGPVNDCWAYTFEPWNYADRLIEGCRMYASLRFRLYPYFYTAMRQAHETGTPILRPMVLEYPADPETYKIATQFFVGDSLLVATSVGLDKFGDHPRSKVDVEVPKAAERGTPVYLPKGTWIDYWTGREFVVGSNSWFDCTFPSYAGGPLLVKEGGIIPTTQVRHYLEQSPAELVTLEIYPAAWKMAQRLYEDDGRSFDYEQGKFANTVFSSVCREGSIAIELGKREGDYTGKPVRRDYLLKVHSLLAPAKVTLDGVSLPVNTKENILFSSDQNGWYYDANANKIVIKPHPGWRFPASGKDPAGTYPLTPAEEAVTFEGQTDHAAVSSHINIVLNPDDRARTGEATAILLEPENLRVLADGHSTVKIAASIRDRNGNIVKAANQSLHLALQGGGSLPPGVEIKEGRGEFVFTAPAQPGEAEIRVADSSLSLQPLKLTAARGKLQIITNPTKKVPLNGKGDFRGKGFYVVISARDEEGHRLACQARVHFVVRDYKDRETIDLQSAPMINGETEFRNVGYKTRPEKFILTATADGLTSATCKTFENAWDLPDDYLEVKDGMLPLLKKH